MAISASLPSRPRPRRRRLLPGVRWAAIALLALGALLPSAAHAETRLALVIGNSSYSFGPLANPKNDAERMAAALKDTGFEVITLIDADQELMKRSILDFGRRLRASDSVGLFYYAGHGVQADGENYLIPIGADISGIEEVALSGVSLTELLKTMERSGSRLNIAILDACRDNPFAGNARGIVRGLAPVMAPSGTLIAYATAPGHVALDGSSSNSPYTLALTEAIPTEGIPIEEAFRRTRRKVLELTSGRQTPWEHSSLTGEFFFKPKVADPQSTARADERPEPTRDARLAEIEAWEKIRASRDPDRFRHHLEAWPDGIFTELATIKLVQLETYTANWSPIVTGSNRAPAGPSRAEAAYEEAVKLDGSSARPADLAKAFALYKEAADLGLPPAMFNLARAYDKARGVERDVVTAAQWYRKAADAGHPAAMASLGTMYEYGEAVPRDLNEALRLYASAAAEGDENAMTSLAFLYQTGKGVARNPGEARRWYAKAIERGQTRAMFNLALMHIKGDGARPDLAEGARLLEKAAGLKHTGAMRELAALYDEGRGVARDAGRAANLLLDAFKAGDAEARRDLMERPDAWSFSTRRTVQQRLAQRGYYSGPAIGFFNEPTRKALERLASSR